MRVGEAIGFQRGDLDTAEGVITLRHSKFGKSRLVPLHASTLVALGSYAQMRDRLLPGRQARPSSSRPPAPGSPARTSARRSGGCSR